MSTTLFDRGVGAAGPASDYGDEEVLAAGSPADTKGIYSKAERGPTVVGKKLRKPDPRLFRYDVVVGRSEMTKFAVTRDDRMSADEAGEALNNLHEKFGLKGENHDVLAAFDESLFFCHTVNGASVLGPGRATFGVPGVTEAFPYSAVRDTLGVDLRRFFRAFADEITEVNRRIIRDHDVFDHASHEKWGWLVSVAQERNLSRYPWLAHDSADACVDLSLVERQALSDSKGAVLSTTVNSADKLSSSARVAGPDRYDSTTLSSY